MRQIFLRPCWNHWMRNAVTSYMVSVIHISYSTLKENALWNPIHAIFMKRHENVGKTLTQTKTFKANQPQLMCLSFKRIEYIE